MDAYYARKAVESLVARRKRERLEACPAADLPPEAADGGRRPGGEPGELPSDAAGLALRESVALVALGEAVGEAGGGAGALASPVPSQNAARVVRVAAAFEVS